MTLGPRPPLLPPLIHRSTFEAIYEFTKYLFRLIYLYIIPSFPLMIISFFADNIDNQVIKGYKKGVKEYEGDQSEIR